MMRLFFIIAGIYAPLASAAIECIDADLILHHGNIYTGNNDDSFVGSIASKGQNIIYVGELLSENEISCSDARVIDINGQYVFPGFTDAHGHLKGIGYRELTLNLQGLPSLAETLAVVRNYLSTKKTDEWIIGRGWIDKVWPEKRFPSKQDLDSFSPNNPVVLERADGHAVVVNSKVLALANIDADTQDPQGGFIERDDNGEPTGLLVDMAMNLIGDLIPKVTRANDKEAFLEGIKRNVSLGWTEIHVPGGTFEDIAILNEIKSENDLLQRIYFMVSDGKPADRLLENGPIIDPEYFLTIRAIKMYADGALGSRGAALLENYSDYDGKGVFIFLEEDTKPRLAKALIKGIQIGTHAIGDHGNRVVLDWYEEAFTQAKKNKQLLESPRWRIEHSQNITPVDQLRFVELDVIPSMQPSHAIGDLHFAVERLGLERINNAYVWRNLIDQGLIIAGGTDAPVEIGDPRIEFYAAIARKDVDGYSAEGWNLDQRLSRVEALKMFTIWPAIASFQENVKGTIEVGKLADFSIFDKDLMTIPELEILESKNLLTVVGGRIVFQE
ncbi:MAG: amidohydrolase [Gammaproteobacteria bacterium TMED236]|nr:MAG: amidohydrolase [Gammaproteobacteria bacterium TMED236]